MPSRPILVHTHFHRRRTGVTRSIENVFPYFELHYESYIYGYGVEGKKISLKKMLGLVFSRMHFVIHCHRNNEILCALLFRFLGGNFRLISTRHAETPPSFLTRFLLKKSDVVISLTKSMSANLSFSTEVVGHGIPEGFFQDKKAVKIMNVSQKNVISCVGRVRTAKGQQILLEELAPLIKGFPDWALVIVGKVDDPNFLENLKRIAGQNEVTNQVYFIEETPKIVSFYQSSHSVIVPSLSEGFSLVCAEAMACGCNVIATKGVGAHADLISDKETGYLFDIHKPKSLQALLLRLFKGELAHLGANAQKAISEKWTAKVEAQKLMELYH